MATAPRKLTGKQRRHLRGLAHTLDPVVQIGVKGLTEAVLAQIDRALHDHELIKVRVRECPDDKATLVAGIESRLLAAVVQVIGHVYVVFRQRARDSRITLPAGSPVEEAP